MSDVTVEVEVTTTPVEVVVSQPRVEVVAPLAPTLALQISDGTPVEILLDQTVVEVVPAVIETVVVEAPAAQGPPGPTGPQGPQGIQGPAGPPGSGGATQTITAVAGQTLSGHRGVRVDELGQAFYADPDDGTTVGITTGAALIGAPVDIQFAGQMTEPSWAWDADEPIFLGSSGVLTQTPDDDLGLVEMGVALSATSMLVRVQITIYSE